MMYDDKKHDNSYHANRQNQNQQFKRMNIPTKQALPPQYGFNSTFATQLKEEDDKTAKQLVSQQKEDGEAREDRIYVPNVSEAKRIVNDLNRLFENKYKFKNAFKVSVKTIPIKRKNPDYWMFSWGEPKYIIVQEEKILVEKNKGFNWDTDRYTKAMSNIIDAPTLVLVDIIPDMSRDAKYGGFLKGHGGGQTDSANKVVLSDKLSKTRQGDEEYLNDAFWTTAAVLLHELIYHIYPGGAGDQNPNIMRKYYKQKTGKPHGKGSRQNGIIKKD